MAGVAAAAIYAGLYAGLYSATSSAFTSNEIIFFALVVVVPLYCFLFHCLRPPVALKANADVDIVEPLINKAEAEQVVGESGMARNIRCLKLLWFNAVQLMLVYIFGAVSSIANVNYPAISAIKVRVPLLRKSFAM